MNPNWSQWGETGQNCAKPGLTGSNWAKQGKRSQTGSNGVKRGWTGPNRALRGKMRTYGAKRCITEPNRAKRGCYPISFIPCPLSPTPYPLPHIPYTLFHIPYHMLHQDWHKIPASLSGQFLKKAAEKIPDWGQKQTSHSRLFNVKLALCSVEICKLGKIEIQKKLSTSHSNLALSCMVYFDFFQF